jgi:hypothetical protein
MKLRNILATAGATNWFDSLYAERVYSQASLVESNSTSAPGGGVYTIIDYRIFNTATEYIIGGDFSSSAYTVNAVDDGALFSFNASIALTGASSCKLACYKNGVLWREGTAGASDGTRATATLRADNEMLSAGDVLTWRVYNPDAGAHNMEGNAGRSYLHIGRSD